MDYMVAVDSCGELTPAMKADGHFVSVPLTIDIQGYTIIDDETFDQKDFLRRAAASPAPPKSACPSPEAYRKVFENDADHLFAVTLSAELSGSCSSAQLGKALCLEEHPEKKIHVFNSRSASIGETLIAMKIQEYEKKGCSFEEIVEKVEAYIDSQTTWFVLESLEALRKNGRLTNLKAAVASVLNIKPVMMSTPTGQIQQLCQVRGINKALTRMVDNIVETVRDPQNRILAISHCNCPQRGEMVRSAITSRINVKDSFLIDTQGISSLYASDGGIIVVI